MIVLKLLKMKMNILANYKNRKQKVIFRTTSGKKICTVKFTKEQFSLIQLAAKVTGETVEEFFLSAIKQIGKK